MFRLFNCIDHCETVSSGYLIQLPLHIHWLAIGVFNVVSDLPAKSEHLWRRRIVEIDTGRRPFYNR